MPVHRPMRNQVTDRSSRLSPPDLIHKPYFQPASMLEQPDQPEDRSQVVGISQYCLPDLEPLASSSRVLNAGS